MIFIVFALMAFAIFMERPSKRQIIDDGLFQPIDSKGLSPPYPSEADGIDLNDHGF